MFSRQPLAAATPPAVLVVDDDAAILDICARWLTLAEVRTVCANSVSRTLDLAAKSDATLAIVDYILPDGSGLDLAVRLWTAHRLPFLLISGHLTVPIAVAAMKAGALGVLEKPLNCEELIAQVKQALHFVPRLDVLAAAGTNQGGVVQSGTSVERWASLVLSAVSAREDPRTVPRWARAVGVGMGTIEETCRLCGVSTRRSRDLARVMRALALSLETRLPVSTFLEVHDSRTLAALLAQAGLSVTALNVPLKLLLAKQTFITKDAACFRVLAHCAANNPRFWNQ